MEIYKFKKKKKNPETHLQLSKPLDGAPPTQRESLEPLDCLL